MMHLAALNQLRNQWKHDYCGRSPLGFIFFNTDWCNLKKITNLYEKFVKADSDSNRELTPDELYECANLLFSLPNETSMAGNRYTGYHSVLSTYSYEINELKGLFKNSHALQFLFDNKLFNQSNFERVIQYAHFDLFSSLKDLKTDGMLNQHSVDRLLNADRKFEAAFAESRFTLHAKKTDHHQPEKIHKAVTHYHRQ